MKLFALTSAAVIALAGAASAAPLAVDFNTAQEISRGADSVNVTGAQEKVAVSNYVLPSERAQYGADSVNLTTFEARGDVDAGAMKNTGYTR